MPLPTNYDTDTEGDWRPQRQQVQRCTRHSSFFFFCWQLAPPLSKTSAHARSQGWWLSSSTTAFHHHLGEGLTPPHIFRGSVSPHHQPASKTSNNLLVFDASGLRTSPCHLPPASKMSTSLLVFDAGGLRTSLPPHHHPPPPKMSTCVLVFSVGLLSTSLPPHYHPPPPLKTSTHVLIFSGCLPYYWCTCFQWCSATYITTTCSHHRKWVLVLIFEGV